MHAVLHIVAMAKGKSPTMWKAVHV